MSGRRFTLPHPPAIAPWRASKPCRAFVRYGPNHPWYDEWVFQRSRYPGSRVVFARMLTPESDQSLAQTMPDRDVWVADPDCETIHIGE